MMGGQPVGVAQMPMLNNDALSQVTTAQLALQRAQKMGITASDAEVAQARQQAIQQSGIAGKLGLRQLGLGDGHQQRPRQSRQPAAGPDLPRRRA